jgi:radical SAM protein with 4Fe4S-binding SPASM domain
MAGIRIENIVFELTQACNQCCRFCYNYWRDGSSPLPAPDPRLARRTLKKLLSQASVGTFSFSGGEPLLLRNVADLALAARFKGSNVNVLTNGTLLTPQALENFVNIGVGAIQIPILSCRPEVHEHLTGLAGSWNRAVDALKRVAQVIPKGAFAVLVITKVNAPDVTGTLELIRDLGVRSVMVNRFNIGGMGLKHIGELVLDRATLKRAFADVEAFGVRYPEMHFVSGVCTPLCVLDPAPYPHIQFTWCSTDFSRRPVAVNYAGDVRFCNHSPHVLGNIYERPIGEILSDPAAAERYSGVPDKCRDCSFLSRCNGGCRAASEQVYGSFSEADPVLEVL